MEKSLLNFIVFVKANFYYSTEDKRKFFAVSNSVLGVDALWS
jgi:hypothetical protein